MRHSDAGSVTPGNRAAILPGAGTNTPNPKLLALVPTIVAAQRYDRCLLAGLRVPHEDGAHQAEIRAPEVGDDSEPERHEGTARRLDERRHGPRQVVS
jgi:hypothetical protein